MATIREKAEEILNEKNTKVLPGNIKAGVTMFNVAGTLQELVGETTTVTPTTEQQVITPSEGKTGITEVTVAPVDNTIDTNIVAENIKKDVTILGVTGTLEEDSGGSTTVEGMQQFNSEEEMQANGIKEYGKLATVYGTKLGNMLATTAAQNILFPQTVVLPEAVTTGTYAMIMSKGSEWGDGNIELSATAFSCQFRSNYGGVSVSYTSNDGVTYTRTDANAETVDFGMPVGCASGYEDMWDDNFGYFMQASGVYYGGLFEYDDYTSDEYIEGSTFNADGTQEDLVFAFGALRDIIPTVVETIPEVLAGRPFDTSRSYAVEKISDTNYNLYVRVYCTSSTTRMNSAGFIHDVDTWRLSDSASTVSSSYYVVDTVAEALADSYACLMFKYALDLTTNSITVTQIPASEFTAKKIGSYTHNVRNTGTELTSIYFGVNYSSLKVVSPTSCHAQTETTYGSTAGGYATLQKYLPAPTQFTATAAHVANKIFFGANGVESGTLQKNTNIESLTDARIKIDTWSALSELHIKAPSIKYLFQDYLGEYAPKITVEGVLDAYGVFDGCTNLLELPLIDTSTATNMGGFINGCDKITTVPLFDTSNATSLIYFCKNNKELLSVPQFNTAKATDMSNMFQYCPKLTTIPELDVSSCTTLNWSFSGCTALSDESLNNILAMCSKVSSAYVQYRYLKYLGLSDAQITTCQTLSNWAAAQANGWTVGS